MPLPLGLTMTRADLRKNGLLASQVLVMLAGFTATPKDDAAAQLIQHLFTDAEHFDKLCTLLGLPPDGLVPPTPA